jgi:PKD repeat protein
VPVTWQFTTLEPAGPTANVQIAHLASFAPQAGSAVTVTLDSTPILTNFAFLDSTTYLTIPVGTHEVGIVPAGSNTPVVTETVNLFAGTDYTILATGDGANQPLDLLLLVDDNSPTIPGFTRFRAGHLAPFAAGTATVDIRLQNGTPVFTNLAYGQTSSYVTLPAGAYDLKVTTPGGGTTLVDPLPVTLLAGDIGSAFMIGDVGNNPLGVYGIFNGDEGDLLPQAPVPGFLSNSPVMIGGTAVFTNTTTPGYWPVSYEWDLGDGTITTDTNPSHVYATPGVYEVILTAENQFATNTIPLVAGFSSNSPIELGSLAVFTNTTTGGGPISYEWDFGDNSAVVTTTNPIHTYAMTGTYMVVLTATNGFDTAVVTGTFTVLEIPTTLYALYLPLVAKPEATQSAPIAFPGGVRRR